jgi:putative ABC transport system substrate-binding protein
MRAAFAVFGIVSVGALLVTAAPAWSQAQRLVRIGALTEGFGPTPWMVGLREGLTELGYRERRDFVIGVRFTRGNPGELALAARQFVEQKVDVLTVGGGPAVRAALAATSQIPIVFIGGGDPVSLGLVKSYSRPGGNVTGVTTMDLELAPKRLEMLRSIVPALKKVLFVYDVADPYTALELKGYHDAARRLGLVLVERPVRTREEAQAALGALRRGDVHGILGPWAMSLNIPGHVLETGARLGLPTMFSEPFYVEGGGLGSYSTDLHGSGRQAARLVDKILRGTPPGDIPIEVDNHIHFALNLKAAQALGLAVPAEAIRRADRVIQ